MDSMASRIRRVLKSGMVRNESHALTFDVALDRLAEKLKPTIRSVVLLAQYEDMKPKFAKPARTPEHREKLRLAAKKRWSRGVYAKRRKTK